MTEYRDFVADALGLEAVAAYGWRGVEEERLGDWLLRAAEGFTGRANSALAIGDPGLPAASAVEYVVDWYRARGLPAMIAVPYPTGRPDAVPLDALLAAEGWTIRSGAATVMTAPSEAVAAPREVEISSEPDDGWLSLYHYRGQELPPIARKLLVSAPWQAFAQVREGGKTIAVGRVAGHDGWAGLTAIEVHTEHRRRGLGVTITAALASEAAAQGFNDLYLQVEDSNTAARALYHRIGFTDHHGYHYRIAPSS